MTTIWYLNACKFHGILSTPAFSISLIFKYDRSRAVSLQNDDYGKTQHTLCELFQYYFPLKNEAMWHMN
jgi:hypothetical protein